MPPNAEETAPLLLDPARLDRLDPKYGPPADEEQPPAVVAQRPRLKARDIPLLLFAAAGSMVEW
jgi:hypothetical protein